MAAGATRKDNMPKGKREGVQERVDLDLSDSEVSRAKAEREPLPSQYETTGSTLALTRVHGVSTKTGYIVAALVSLNCQLRESQMRDCLG